MLWFLGYMVVAFVVAVGFRAYHHGAWLALDATFAVFCGFFWPLTLPWVAYSHGVDWCARRLGGKG